MAKEKKVTMTVLDQFNEVYDFLTENDAPEEMAAFIESRALQVSKSAESAKAARIKKNGGEKKETAQAEYYVTLRNKLYPILSTAPQTGAELLAQIDTLNPNGKPYQNMQVATAFQPLIADGTVVTTEKKVAYVDKNGLNKESMHVAYALA